MGLGELRRERPLPDHGKAAVTEATVTAIAVAGFAALPPTLVAYLAYRQSTVNAKKAEETSKKVDEVHILANSTLSTATSALAVANEKIAGMEKLLTEIAKRRTEPAPPPVRSKKKSSP
jgi:hypothetical protein